MATPKHAIADGAPHKPNALMSLGGELFEDFFNSIVEQLDASAGLSEEQNATLGTYLQTTNKEVVEKRDRLGEFLVRMKAEATSIREEEKRLAARRASFEKVAGCIEDSIHVQMVDFGITKAEGKLFSFCVQKNPASVEIENPDAVPAEFISYQPQIDKAAIKAALQGGKEVLGAKLITNKTHLRIR